MLAEIERRVLPKARRLTPGQFAGEVAKAIALLDPDAAARHRKARETRRVWSRQLEDGMGYLGMTHEWPGALCTTCHQLKTAGHADITDSSSDGSCTWRTAWGQTVHVPPRPVLDDPDPPPTDPAPPLDPPPF